MINLKCTITVYDITYIYNSVIININTNMVDAIQLFVN